MSLHVEPLLVSDRWHNWNDHNFTTCSLFVLSLVVLVSAIRNDPHRLIFCVLSPSSIGGPTYPLCQLVWRWPPNENYQIFLLKMTTTGTALVNSSNDWYYPLVEGTRSPHQGNSRKHHLWITYWIWVRVGYRLRYRLLVCWLPWLVTRMLGGAGWHYPL